MKLLKTISWYKSDMVVNHQFLNEQEELTWRREMEQSKNDCIIDKYTIQEIPLHMVHDITKLKGLSLAHLQKLILYKPENTSEARTVTEEYKKSDEIDPLFYIPFDVKGFKDTNTHTDCYSTKEI